MLFEKEDQDILNMLLAATYKLRSSLDIPSNFVNYRQPDSKCYYIATVLDQMLSLETTMLRWNNDFVIDEGIEIDNLMCSITQAAYCEVQMYRRKNIEVLAKLILFQDTDSEEYYRHFILVNQYTLYNRISQDYKDFYSIIPNNITYTLNEIKKDIEENKKRISSEQCWFIDKKGEKECSFRQILKSAILKANTYEKMVLGLTYQDYSTTSENIHSNIYLSEFKAEEIKTKCQTELLRIGMIVNKCQELLNLYPESVNYNLKSFIDSISGENLWIKPLFQDIYKINDYVCTIDEALARITKVIESKVRYKSYQVKYLDGSNLPREYGEYGEYPAHYLKRFHSRKQLQEVMIKNASPTLKKLFAETPEEKITEGFDNLILKWWQNGYKEKVVYGDETKFAKSIKIMNDYYNNDEMKKEIEKLAKQKIKNK